MTFAKRHPKIILLLVSAIWGVAVVILKDATNAWPFAWLLAIRFLLAGILMMILFRKDVCKMRGKVLLGAIGAGVSCGVAYIIETWGLLYTTPGICSFLVSIYCVVTPVLSWLFFKERISGLTIVAALLCVFGVGFISSTGKFSLGVGEVLALISTIFYAFQIILIGRTVQSVSPLAVSSVEFFSAGVLSLTVALATQKFPESVSLEGIEMLLFLSIVSTCIATTLQAVGQQYIDTAQTALLMSLEAPFGVLFSLFWGYEKLSYQLVIGFLFIFLGILVSQKSKKIHLDSDDSKGAIS